MTQFLGYTGGTLILLVLAMIGFSLFAGVKQIRNVCHVVRASGAEAHQQHESGGDGAKVSDAGHGLRRDQRGRVRRQGHPGLDGS